MFRGFEKSLYRSSRGCWHVERAFHGRQRSAVGQMGWIDTVIEARIKRFMWSCHAIVKECRELANLTGLLAGDGRRIL